MKNQLVSLLSLTTVSFLLIGCSSIPTPNPDPIGYCTTDENISVQNDSVVSSQVTLNCSDDPIKRAKYAGVDPANCRTWSKTMVINGTTKQTHGVLCKDENGNFRPLDQF